MWSAAQKCEGTPMAVVTASIRMFDQRSHWLTAAALGGLIWAGSVALLWPGEDADARSLAGVQLLLSPLALLPLALALICPMPLTRGWRWAVWLQLPAATFLVGAFT